MCLVYMNIVVHKYYKVKSLLHGWILSLPSTTTQNKQFPRCSPGEVSYIPKHSYSRIYFFQRNGVVLYITCPSTSCLSPPCVPYIG